MYEATCSKCSWTGGRYADVQDRDNAESMHQTLAHGEDQS